MRGGGVFCEGLPIWAGKRVQRRIDIDPKKIQGEIESIKDRFLRNLGGAMLVLLPAFALWLKLGHRIRRLLRIEPVVSALHLRALWFVALLHTLPGWSPSTAGAFLAVPVSTPLAMKRVHGGRLGPRLLRARRVSALGDMTLGLGLAGGALIAVLA